MNRRGFLGALAGVIGAGVGRRYFDIGTAWRRHESGLMLPRLTVDDVEVEEGVDVMWSGLPFNFTTNEFLPPDKALLANPDTGELLAVLEFSGPEFDVGDGEKLEVKMNANGVLTLG